jgi:hypothetical protein
MEYFVYFELFRQSQAENPPSECARGFIQRFPCAPDAGSAAGTIAAAGGSARFFVADHDAQQQADDQRNHGDKRDIDEIGGKPYKHRISSFR